MTSIDMPDYAEASAELARLQLGVEAAEPCERTRRTIERLITAIAHAHTAMTQRGTLSPLGSIHGGTGANTVPDRAVIDVDRRLTPDAAVAAEIAASHKEWLAKWMPKLTHNDAPLNPYRVLWDLQHTVDIENTIITHDAGSPRDQLSPFWRTTQPHTYIGWGKTTQLGYGLGLAMGAKLAEVLPGALLAKARAPRDVNPVDWVAERAWLLLRLGEADEVVGLVRRRAQRYVGVDALEAVDP